MSKRSLRMTIYYSIDLDGSVCSFEGTKAQWLSWLERRPVTAEVAGSSPAWVVLSYGILAQLGEHLPYKQRVIGSSPIGPTFYKRNGLCRCGSIGRAADL
jgi:hypothetical protein